MYELVTATNRFSGYSKSVFVEMGAAQKDR